jgi:hypothetical protein
MRMISKLTSIGVAAVLAVAIAPAGTAVAQDGGLGLYGSSGMVNPKKTQAPGTVTPPSPGQSPAPGGPPSPPPSFLRDIGGFMFRCGVGGGYGTGSCHLLPPPKPGKPGEPGGSTPGGTLGTFGPGGTPTEECATDWTVNYGGRTYPMSGAQCAGPVSTGWIEAVCNAAPTGGTV